VIRKDIRNCSSGNRQEGRASKACEETEYQVDGDVIGECDRQVEHYEIESAQSLHPVYVYGSLTPEYRKAQVQDSASTDELAGRAQEH
jgi:hypothetical protein